MRVIHWESKLQDYIQECREKEFEYGVFDCCVFTIQAQKLIIGKTLFPEFDNTYKSLEEGKKILKNIGFKTWISACNKRLKKIDIKFAQRGDVVSMNTQDSFIMGLCMGKHAIFVSEEKGLVFLPIEQVKLAWSIE
jgi:hypothetical protein